MFAIYISAGHDRNGNPKRGWIIASSDGSFIDFVDEGFEGYAALKLKYPNITTTEGIEVVNSSYSDAKKLGARASGHSKHR